jgi:uncharacterized protein with FMN-binding domain
MRRIVIWLASTVTVVVLLFGYRTSTNGTSVSAESSVVIPSTAAAAPTSAPSGSSSSGTSSAGGSTSSGSTSSSSTPSSSPGSSSSSTATHTGSVVQTRWGPVQVQVTVTGGTISAVDVLQCPQGNGKDQQINAYALPILVQETLSAQSANIDMVSGATVTSDGYVESLQAALDEAGI